MAQPVSPSSSDISVDELSKDDILDVLNEGDEVETDTDEEEGQEEKIEEKKTKESDESDDEEEEDEIELKEDEEEEDDDKLPDDEELELTTPVRRKEILAKYPKLFKDFPYLEKAYYREQQYTEIFPSIDDAKEAVEQVTTFKNLESEVLDGNITNLLYGIKEESPEGFAKVADNYLEALGKVDPQAQYHVMGNVIKRAIITMANEAQRQGPDQGKQLNAAAQLLNQVMFGTSEFHPPANLFQEKEVDNSKEEKLQEDRLNFLTERFQLVSSELQDKVSNTLKNTVLEHIDPKDSMTAYVKKQAVRDAMEDLEASIASDKRFQTILDSLWRRATDNNFSQDSVRKIRSTYLAKAKTVLLPAIKKARREALKGPGKSDSDDSNRSSQSSSSRGRATVRQASSSGRQTNDGKGMSTVDFFNQD